MPPSLGAGVAAKWRLTRAKNQVKDNAARPPDLETESPRVCSRCDSCLGLDVYEEEEALFFEDLSSHVIQDDVFARANDAGHWQVAATTLWFGPTSYTATLQGSSSPISVSTCKARCARVGLHAPRMTYLRKSASSV